VKSFLDERRLVALRLHVVGPTYVDASISARVAAKPGEKPGEVQGAIMEALARFLDPLPGDGGAGWPFGRDLHVSEVCEVIEGVAGVDHVEKVSLTGGATTAGNRVPVPPDSLVHFDVAASDIRVTTLGGT
jgi:hypothetical protein